MMLDVVWPGAFAPYLVNLKPALGKASKQFAQGIVQNDTIGGKLDRDAVVRRLRNPLLPHRTC